MTSCRGLVLPLAAVAVLLGNLYAPALAFRASPSIPIHKHAAAMRSPATAAAQRQRRSTIIATTSDRASATLLRENSREQDMMDQVLREQEFRRVQQESEQMPQQQRDNSADPLIASLTRIDEPTPNNVPTRQVPLFGEVPADGNLALLAPVVAIGVLGFIFSIVVAFNSRDEIVREVSRVELPKMEYTPTKVVEGQCRGLCSSQEEDLDGLRNFMEGLRRD